MVGNMTNDELLGQMNQIKVGAYVDWNNGGEKTLNVSLVQDYAAHGVGGYLNLIPGAADWGMPLWNAT
ncbi:hypothetical protein LEN26_011539 [Aphanomyces euteiches]|nr:hypothetical protein AeMF1_012415 [Aphanomyces euteiches]KAH9119650.1 hypothetical protein LEN26_011539 [Aphanomyces euteiches]KAH9196148.1 hypothetical protein AeNC1_001886 [Aphanomyces euteiches]